MRLHYLSWIVFVFTAASMMLIVVPGIPSQSIEWEQGPGYTIYGTFVSEPEFRSVSIWSHGWPFEYLRRPFKQSKYFLVFDNDNLPVAWSSLAAWTISGQVYWFSLPYLLADILIGSAIALLAVLTCQWWRSKRRGFQFSLSDIGIILTLSCFALGWVKLHSNSSYQEKTIAAAMRARNTPAKKNVRPQRLWTTSCYQGPLWLERLVGNPYLLPFCIHVDALFLDLRLLKSEDYIEIGKLSYVHAVHCNGSLSEEFVAFLASLPNLQILDGSQENGFSMSDIPKPLVTTENIDLLLRLPNLKTLYLRRWSKIAPDDLNVLARMPNLEKLELCNDDILVEDLSCLTSFRRLKEVQVQIAATNAELEAFQKAHPNLKVFWDKHRNVDDWRIVQLRLARWRGKTQPPLPLSWDRGHLILSDILLTSERLKQLPEALTDIGELVFGKVDSSLTAIKLIERCGRLWSLDLRYVPMSKRELMCLSLPEGIDLYIQQGSLTAKDCLDVIRHQKTSNLIVFNSTFTRDEADDFENTAYNIPSHAESYRGFSFDESDLINQPLEDSDGIFFP